MEPTEAEQLLDMAAVHAFYIGLLEDVLGHPVPVPHEVGSGTSEAAIHQSVTALQRWLNLLDLAITPPMVRDALKESTTRETAEALLRHFVTKASTSDADRDKTDFVITFLYRSLVPMDKQVPAEMKVEEPSEFEEVSCTRCELPGNHGQQTAARRTGLQIRANCRNLQRTNDEGAGRVLTNPCRQPGALKPAQPYGNSGGFCGHRRAQVGEGAHHPAQGTIETG